MKFQGLTDDDHLQDSISHFLLKQKKFLTLTSIFPHSFSSQVDCSQVWKLVETTSEVSPKFPKQGI